MLYKNCNKYLLFTIIFLINLSEIYSNQACENIMPISYCFTVSQCRDIGLSGHLDCINGQCCCTNGTKNFRQGCYWRNYLGDKCEYNADCVIKKSLCLDKKCECSERMVIRNGTCQQPEKKYLGDTCENKEECIIEKSICLNRICECPEGMILKAGICQEHKKYLGDNCENTKNCVIENSMCVQKKCECPERMILRNGKCQELEKKYLGENCKNSSECIIRGSVCLETKCDCPKLMIFKNGICQKLNKDQKYLGDSCTNNDECASAIEHSLCVQEKCECPDKMMLKNGTCVVPNLCSSDKAYYNATCIELPIQNEVVISKTTCAKYIDKDCSNSTIMQQASFRRYIFLLTLYIVKQWFYDI